MKHVTKRISLSLCSVVLLVLLAACGGSTGATTTNTTTATPTPKPPTPTPTPAVVVKTYTGTSFTIGYPADWTPTDQQGLGVAINDPLKANAVSVFAIPLPTPKTSEQVAAGEVSTLIPLVLKDAQPVSVAPTTTLAGDTWVQKAFTGTASANGQNIKARIYMLVDVHPASGANSKAYVILYGGPDATFDAENTMYLQPMLQSFKFTA